MPIDDHLATESSTKGRGYWSKLLVLTVSSDGFEGMEGLTPRARQRVWRQAIEGVPSWALWAPSVGIFAGLTLVLVLVRWRLESTSARFEPLPIEFTFALLAAALWAPFALGGLALQARAVSRKLRELIPHLCSACGYDLTGNTSGLCPECGREIDGKRDDADRSSGQ